MSKWSLVENLAKVSKVNISDSAQVDDEFLKLWRSVTVDAMDDAKIDEYLEKQGRRAATTCHRICYTHLFRSLKYNEVTRTIRFAAGIRIMQDNGVKKPVLMKRKKSSQKKRQFKKPRDNDHLADVLETYEDNTITQVGIRIKQ